MLQFLVSQARLSRREESLVKLPNGFHAAQSEVQQLRQYLAFFLSHTIDNAFPLQCIQMPW